MILEDRATALYRFFGADDLLLYIGITNSVPRRFDQHGDKPWWTQVERSTLEHYPSRREALAAEKAAIQAEKPVWNVCHNKVHKEGKVTVSREYRGEDLPQYEFYARRGRMKHVQGLFLYPELDGSSVVDEYYGLLDGEGQLEAYVEYIESKHPGWWQNDAVPIVWGVEPTSECAPFQSGLGWRLSRESPDLIRTLENGANFLTYYTWPVDVRTRERLDWFSLPVRIDLRFQEYAQALAWVPTPLQPFCPLRSIMESRAGSPSKYHHWRRAT